MKLTSPPPRLDEVFGLQAKRELWQNWTVVRTPDGPRVAARTPPGDVVVDLVNRAMKLGVVQARSHADPSTAMLLDVASENAFLYLDKLPAEETRALFADACKFAESLETVDHEHARLVFVQTTLERLIAPLSSESELGAETIARGKVAVLALVAATERGTRFGSVWTRPPILDRLEDLVDDEDLYDALKRLAVGDRSRLPLVISKALAMNKAAKSAVGPRAVVREDDPADEKHAAPREPTGAAKVVLEILRQHRNERVSMDQLDAALEKKGFKPAATSYVKRLISYGWKIEQPTDPRSEKGYSLVE